MATALADALRDEGTPGRGGNDSPETSDAKDDNESALESVELIEKMLVGVTDQAKAILNAEKCTLWLVNPKTQAMWSFLANVTGEGTKMNDEAATSDNILHITVGTGLVGVSPQARRPPPQPDSQKRLTGCFRCQICAQSGEVITVDDAWEDDRFDKTVSAQVSPSLPILLHVSSILLPTFPLLYSILLYFYSSICQVPNCLPPPTRASNHPPQ